TSTYLRTLTLRTYTTLFRSDKAGSHYNVEKRTRTISRINKIYECSIVPFPAYQTTSVEARNQMSEAEQQEKQKRAARIKINQLLDRKSTRLNSSHVSISYAV